MVRVIRRMLFRCDKCCGCTGARVVYVKIWLLDPKLGFELHSRGPAFSETPPRTVDPLPTCRVLPRDPQTGSQTVVYKPLTVDPLSTCPVLPWDPQTGSLDPLSTCPVLPRGPANGDLNRGSSQRPSARFSPALQVRRDPQTAGALLVQKYPDVSGAPYKQTHKIRVHFTSAQLESNSG